MGCAARPRGSGATPAAGSDVRFAVLLVMTVACGGVGCTSAEQRGQQLYAERGCAVCHGSSGHGDGPAAKRLDTRPRDLADVRAYRQGSSQDEVAASIRSGAGAMPAFRDLTAAEATDIAAWIVALQHQPGAGPAREP
jgi:high-affinity iron transporter